jgi:hypothetical protein
LLLLLEFKRQVLTFAFFPVIVAWRLWGKWRCPVKKCSYLVCSINQCCGAIPAQCAAVIFQDDLRRMLIIWILLFPTYKKLLRQFLM